MKIQRNGSRIVSDKPRGAGTDRRRLGKVVSKAFAAAFSDDVQSSGHYVIQSRDAMACTFQVFLRPQESRFIPAVHEALNEVDRLEQQMSVYREDSELSGINRSAFPGPTVVERRLYELLCRARKIGQEAGGAFDITTGPLVRCWGFFERSGRIPDREELQRARSLCGWGDIKLDDAERTVQFRRPGMEINLGSIGKGYALDRAAEFLIEAGLENFMIHAGHSSILACGHSNRSPGWMVSLRDPYREGGVLGTVHLRNRAMSTSGTGHQFFVSEGKKYGHLLDPRTGEPSLGAVLCSVIAPTAAEADALSTALFVMLPEDVEKYCELHPSVGTLRLECSRTGKAPAPFIRRFLLRPAEASS